MNLPRLSRVAICSLLLGATVWMWSGCVVGRQTAFNPADFGGMTRKGTGVVTGQVSVDTQNHGTIYPHFQQILLVPVNAYTTENVQRRFINGENLRAADKRLSQYEWAVNTDGDGNFSFRGIPAGEYYLKGDMPWITTYVSTDDQGISQRLYVSHFKYYFTRITVKDGQTARATQFDQRSRERQTHYAVGGTLYHPPPNVEIFEQH
ncbi:hypothetical protein [Chthoniobacter flavus]|nr:hypothetical protein [Chthoniobacter flavus]